MPLDLGRLTNLLGTPDEVRARIEVLAAAGITTLLAKLDGDADAQLAVIERLVPLLPR